jgi:hypothetical protein
VIVAATNRSVAMFFTLFILQHPAENEKGAKPKQKALRFIFL